MTVAIGTSGWQYRDWRGPFYPRGLATSAWLEHYGAQFGTVEVNNAFYRLPERRVFEAWAARTPSDFVMAVKASRYLTHVRRLRDPKEPVHRLVQRLEGLGAKRGPVLLQLPPTLPVDGEALNGVLRSFPAAIRVAVEARHASWFVASIRKVLERRGAALCLTDDQGRHPPLWRTTDWGYVRFHRGRAAPAPRYGRRSLATWAERVADLWGTTEDVYCYFNNDALACAPRDARQFALACRRVGLEVGRVPSTTGPGTTGGAGPMTPP